MKNDMPATNTTYGFLRVVEDLGMVENANGVKHHMVCCECKCGVVKDYYLANLKNGKTQSCGCIKKSGSLINRQFDHLKVVGEAEPRIGYSNGKPVKHKMVHCVCDCGNELDVSVNNLVTGKTRSCGCLRKGSKRTRYAHGSNGDGRYEQYYNQTFNHLTVLGEGEPKIYKSKGVERTYHTLRCRCDCGNEVDILASSVLSGKIEKCGRHCKGGF